MLCKTNVLRLLASTALLWSAFAAAKTFEQYQNDYGVAFHHKIPVLQQNPGDAKLRAEIEKVVTDLRAATADEVRGEQNKQRLLKHATDLNAALKKIAAPAAPTQQAQPQPAQAIPTPGIPVQPAGLPMPETRPAPLPQGLPAPEAPALRGLPAPQAPAAPQGLPAPQAERKARAQGAEAERKRQSGLSNQYIDARNAALDQVDAAINALKDALNEQDMAALERRIGKVEKALTSAGRGDMLPKLMASATDANIYNLALESYSERVQGLRNALDKAIKQANSADEKADLATTQTTISERVTKGLAGQEAKLRRIAYMRALQQR